MQLEVVGLAFSVAIKLATDVPDSIFLQMEQPYLDFSRSCLGTLDQDMITLDTCLKDQFRWDIALARTDQQAKVGHGEICTINCIMEVGPLKTSFLNGIPLEIELRNGSKINLQFRLVFFFSNCVEKPRRSAAMPTFFALLEKKNPTPKLCNFIFKPFLTNIYYLNQAGTCTHIPSEKPQPIILSQQNYFQDLTINHTMSFQISPNPASKWVRIRVNQTKPKPLTIQVYDVLGSVVLKEIHNSPEALIELPISRLKQGIYFIQVDDGEQRANKKLVVTN